MPYIDALHAVVLGMQVSASLACVLTCMTMVLSGSGDPAVYLPVLAGVVGYWMPSPARVTYISGCVVDDACSASDSVDEDESDPEENPEENPEEEEDPENPEEEEGHQDSASSVDTPDLIRFTDDDERVPLLAPRVVRDDDDDDGVLGPLEDVD